MEFYHVLNRGVDKRDIFLNEKDYLRFVHNLFDFNDQKKADTNRYVSKKPSIIDLRGPRDRGPRETLVDIHAFCLMPNHYHLLLSPKEEKNIPKFMMKLNVGYVKYFNEKYKRTGTLFEGRYKSIIIKKDSHFLYLPYYIHFNPLDLKFPQWRENKIEDYQKAIDLIAGVVILTIWERRIFPRLLKESFY
jgi:putative transposase